MHLEKYNDPRLINRDVRVGHYSSCVRLECGVRAYQVHTKSMVSACFLLVK